MKLSSEIPNMILELKRRYEKIITSNNPAKVIKANEIISALYALSCGSLVVALNALGGKGWRKVMIDKKGVKALSVQLSGIGMIDKTLYNIEQFIAITGALRDSKSKAMMNRYMAEWYNVADNANYRIYSLLKERGT